MKLHTLLSSSHALRHRMLHFIDNLYYYMAFEVSELGCRWCVLDVFEGVGVTLRALNE